jgi:Na+-transporting methylmalonyl-CoA/oxaloacetate decarboxylase gamma subunit
MLFDMDLYTKNGFKRENATSHNIRSEFFGNMSGGHLIGIVFFVLLIFAAYTTTMGMLEPIVAWLEEKYPGKRKLLSATQTFSADEDGESETAGSERKLEIASSEYLPREKLKENKRKLDVYIQGFFCNVLKRLSEDPGELAQIINEIVPLFVEHQIRVRFYQAFSQIRSNDDLNTTLEKISKDVELENFELFCSALFVFYSAQK